ncbi:MAG: Rieske 2Fe-2S domain-containing protein, partial [Actinomycetales bacterium]
MSTPFTPAPLSAEGLARAMAPFGQSRMLPTQAYTSDEVFKWELEHFFSGWQCIGRSDELAEPGMQRAQQVGATSVFLARGEDGILRAFANACRHR